MIVLNVYTRNNPQRRACGSSDFPFPCKYWCLPLGIMPINVTAAPLLVGGLFVILCASVILVTVVVFHAVKMRWGGLRSDRSLHWYSKARCNCCITNYVVRNLSWKIWSLQFKILLVPDHSPIAILLSERGRLAVWRILCARAKFEARICLCAIQEASRGASRESAAVTACSLQRRKGECYGDMMRFWQCNRYLALDLPCPM